MGRVDRVVSMIMHYTDHLTCSMCDIQFYELGLVR